MYTFTCVWYRFQKLQHFLCTMHNANSKFLSVGWSVGTSIPDLIHWIQNIGRSIYGTLMKLSSILSDKLPNRWNSNQVYISPTPFNTVNIVLKIWKICNASTLFHTPTHDLSSGRIRRRRWDLQAIVPEINRNQSPNILHWAPKHSRQQALNYSNILNWRQQNGKHRTQDCNEGQDDLESYDSSRTPLYLSTTFYESELIKCLTEYVRGNKTMLTLYKIVSF